VSFETIVATDAADLARRVAERFRELTNEARAGRLAVALSGGHTPRRLYELLATPAFAATVRWGTVEFFFGDERAVAPDHPESNYRMAREALLSTVAAAAHRMPAETGEAAAYERLLRERIRADRDGIPVFDLILLGMGSDGHTASLFPGSAALGEHSRLVVMSEAPRLGSKRMTLTYPALNAARRVWILAPGVDKREIVGQCLAVRETPGAEQRFPVVGVRPAHGELIWWLDEASAGG
jgi:6-phosphogluconolactonase